MTGPHAVLPVLVALDGDSLAGNSAAIAVLALISMVVGYALLAGLWYFVLRRSPEERDAERQAQAARAEAVRQWRPSTGPSREAEPATRAPTPRHDGQPLR